MWKILLGEFFNDLRTQKTRAFLTMFAVAWGTLAISLLLAFGEGMKIQMVNGLLNAGDKVVRIYGGETSIVYQGLPKGRPVRFTEEDYRLIQSVPEVDQVTRHYGRWGTRLTYERNSTTTYAIGVEPSFGDMSRMYPQDGGRFLNAIDYRDKKRVVFLGDKMAERLYGKDSPVGKLLEIDGIPFTVIGVMQNKLQTSMSNGPDANRAVIPASTWEAIYGPRTIPFFVVRPKNVLESETMMLNIKHVLARYHKFDLNDDQAISTWDFIENERESRKVFLGIQLFLGAVGTLTLIIAGVGVANIMYVVVKERTTEIGIKLAVGARRRHVLAQFLFESVLICATGGAVGFAISMTLIKLVSMIPAQEGAMAYFGKPQVSMPILLSCIGMLIGIGLFAGFFPARRAANLDPVESLRYE
jgi:putative ABC transport system permease protein